MCSVHQLLTEMMRRLCLIVSASRLWLFSGNSDFQELEFLFKAI